MLSSPGQATGRRLILVRHSTPEICRDVPAAEWHLSPDGVLRARAFAPRLQPVDALRVFTSSEPKAVETARTIAERLELSIEEVAGLYEHERPQAQMLSRDVFEEKVRTLFVRPGEVVFGAETADHARHRFTRAVMRIVTRTDRDVIVISHGTVDVTTACRHLLWWLHRGQTRVVRMSFAGLAGDSGGSCPYAVLLGPAAVHTRLAHDRPTFERALSSREIRRVVRSTTITHGSWCMTYCTGLCNRELLPPFMPIGRNQDGLFGAMLVHIDPAAMSAHLPFGIVHDSDRPSAYSQPVLSAPRPLLSDIIAAPLLQGRADTMRTDRDERLRHLGEVLCDVARSDPDGLVAFAGRAVLERRCQHLAAADSAKGNAEGHWRDALDAYRQSLMENAGDPGFFVPGEIAASGPIDERRRRLQTFVARFGRLMCAWPDIVKAAHHLQWSDLVER